VGEQNRSNRLAQVCLDFVKMEVAALVVVVVVV